MLVLQYMACAGSSQHTTDHPVGSSRCGCAQLSPLQILLSLATLLLLQRQAYLAVSAVLHALC